MDAGSISDMSDDEYEALLLDVYDLGHTISEARPTSDVYAVPPGGIPPQETDEH